MSDTYNKFEHTHVTISPPAASKEDKCVWRGTFGILLHLGDRVFVSGSYSHFDTYRDDLIRVSDGRSAGYDEDGNCIMSVPISWCRFHTEDEAENIERRIEAVNRLRSYAY